VIIAPAATPSVLAIQESPKVTIKIETKPSGAKIKKSGFQVCDSTPCEIEVDRGEAIELTAELGSKKGVSKVEAQEDQTVEIMLRGRTSGSSGGGDKMCEVPGPGGLKIFRKCK
jgi:hypothetical protein